MDDTEAFRGFLATYEAVLNSPYLTTAEKTAVFELLGIEWVGRKHHPDVDVPARRLLKDPAIAVRSQAKKPKA